MTEISSRQLYASARDDLIELARSLDEEQVGTKLPLSPEWTVKDAVSHVCGIVSDLLGGRMEGSGSDEWTARQVAERADRSIGEICDEWLSYSAAFDEELTRNPFRGIQLTGDLIVHTHDVRHALGLPIDQNSAATITGAHRYVPVAQKRAAERLGVSLSIELSDGTTWPGPECAAQLRLETTPYDFLRSVTGRRSRRQVEALNWTGDPSLLLDEAWAIYGSLRAEDVSI